MVATAGCTDILGDDNDVLLNLTASNQTNDEQEVRIVIQDQDEDTIYNEVFDLEVSDDEPSLTLEGIIASQDGVELTARVLLQEHDTEETFTFELDCPADVRESGLTVNDNLFVGIPATDEVDFSHNGCA